MTKDQKKTIKREIYLYRIEEYPYLSRNKIVRSYRGGYLIREKNKVSAPYFEYWLAELDAKEKKLHFNNKWSDFKNSLFELKKVGEVITKNNNNG